MILIQPKEIFEKKRSTNTIYLTQISNYRDKYRDTPYNIL